VGFNDISEGKHLAKCESIELGLTSTGKEQAKIKFAISDRDDPDHGKWITAFVYFTPAATSRAIEALRAMGWRGTDITEIENLAAMGQLANEVVVAYEEWKGKTSAKVKYINDPNKTQTSVMSDEAKRAFAARIRESMGEPEPVGSFADDLPEWAGGKQE
jgi:hypothetical protein